MASLPISLIVAYSIWYYFLGHQMSHVVYASQGRASAPSFLPLYTSIARVLGIAFLIYYGFTSQWHFALILYVVGFVGQFLLVNLETSLGLQKQAGSISLTGVAVMPIVLVYMLYVASNSHAL